VFDRKFEDCVGNEVRLEFFNKETLSLRTKWEEPLD